MKRKIIKDSKMKKRKIFVTESDRIKLKKLFLTTIGFRRKDLKTVKDLLEELERAEVITDEKINENIITMNSTVLIKDLDLNKEFVYTIVYPEHADNESNRISILAPIGTALLGYKVGDTVELDVPSGKRKLKIKKILFQPESATRINQSNVKAYNIVSH